MSTEVDPSELELLQEERTFLLQSLADLDDELAAGDLDRHDYQTLRDEYTARAAAVLRALERADEQGPEPTDGLAGDARVDPGPEPTSEAGATAPDGSLLVQGAAPRASTARRWTSRPVLVSVLVVVFAMAVGALVARGAGTRLPGTGPSGANPSELSSVLSSARSKLGGDRPAALTLYDQALALEPGNVEALAYKGWLLRLDGQTEEAEALLRQAIELDPGYPDAHAFLGVLLGAAGDPVGALEQFSAYEQSDPPPDLAALVATPKAEAIVALLDQARGQLDAAPTDALKTYDLVLTYSPRESEALSFKGYLIAQTGAADLVDRGLALIEDALKASPPFPYAYLFKARVLLQGKQDCAGAAQAYQAFLDTKPSADEAALATEELQRATSC